MTGILIFAAALLIIGLPIIASWVALWCIPKWAKTVSARQKAEDALKLTFERSSSGSLTVAATAVVVLQLFGAYGLRHTADIETSVAWLFIVTFAGVMISLYFVGRVMPSPSIMTCPGCQWLWGLLVIIAIWFGRARTQTDLAQIFGPVSQKLPTATNVGVFLRAFGHISLAMAVMTCVVELLTLVVYLGFDRFFGKPAPGNEHKRARGWISVFNMSMMLMAAGMSGASASALGFNAQPVLASVARVAADTDLLPEASCTGNAADKQRRIVFRSDELEQALVFRMPQDMLSEKPFTKLLKHWNAEDYSKAMPMLVDLDKDCKLITQ